MQKIKWRKLLRVIGVLCVLIAIIVTSTACGCENTKISNPPTGSSASSEGLPSKLQDGSNTIPNGNSSEGQSGAVSESAVRIDQGGENYSYDGWELTAEMPGCFQYVNPVWNTKTVDYGTVWTNGEENSSEITYQWMLDLKGSPEEEIQKQYGSIINGGNGAEYGAFKSKYLAEAYYCKYQENGYTYIYLYGWHYPEGFVKSEEGETLIALSYKGGTGLQGDGATPNEDDYWKVAQSMYIAGDEGSTPYIPPQS